MSSLGGPVNCDVRGGDPTVSGPFGDPELVRYGLIASAPAPSAEEVELPRGAVEVIVMWGDSTVLSVEHLSPVRRYDVGETTKPGPATRHLAAGRNAPPWTALSL